jgi:hypothetical protein
VPKLFILIAAIVSAFTLVIGIMSAIQQIYYCIKMIKYGVDTAAEVTKVVPGYKDKYWHPTTIYIRLMNEDGKYEEVKYSVQLDDFTRDKLNVRYVPTNFNLVVAKEPDIKLKTHYDLSDILPAIWVMLVCCGLLYWFLPELLKLL